MQLKFWINAFIPRTVGTYTIPITRGTHAGKTAIPLPGAARMNPLNTFKNWDAGFLTDQRGFDANPSASVRMRSVAEVNVSVAGAVLMFARHETSGTTEVDTDTGAQIAFAPADMSRCRWGMLRPVAPGPLTAGTVRVPFVAFVPLVVGHRTSRVLTFEIDLIAAAGDPLVSTAADIDYEGKFTFSFNPANMAQIDLTFEGKLDSFPAFEAYGQYNGRTKTLFTAVPPPGNTVMNLAGFASRPIGGSVRFP